MTLRNIGLALAALFAVSVALAAGPYPQQFQTSRYGGEKTIQMLTGGGNQIDCGFIVNAADTGGAGITNLKSGNAGDGCASVYMHTSQTPATSQNPPTGYVIVNLKKPYSGYQAGIYHIEHAPLVTTSPVPIASLTPSEAVTITTVGTTSTAGFVSLGFPAGVAPSVGNPFITPSPLPSPLPTGTATFNTPSVAGSGITDIEVLGTPVARSTNAQVILRFLAPSSAFSYNSGTPANSTVATTLVVTQPADLTVVGLRFTMKGPVITLQ